MIRSPADAPPQPRGFMLLCASSIFLGAFLLFQVQPMISKMILPWFGGGPSVWTTCMLFFQVALLGGYAYAHALMRLPVRRQAMVHLVLLIAALALSGVTPAASWKPEDSLQPVARILTLLTVTVGVPYLALAANGPLLQAWFARRVEDRVPYRLYSLSNVGSLAALLSYPFLIEPLWTTDQQSAVWTGLFVLFAMTCAGVAVQVWRAEAEREDAGATGRARTSPTAVAASSDFRKMDLLRWLLYPAFASMMLLAVTNHICQDVAVIPFLWIAPLSLYLLTFILCFHRDWWYPRGTTAFLTGLVILMISVIHASARIEDALALFGFQYAIPRFLDHLLLEVGGYLIALFLICMICHGELVRKRPPIQHLTLFYLMVATGGALGGMTVALVAPRVFSDYTELHVGMVVAFLLSLAILWELGQWNWLGRFGKSAVFAPRFSVAMVGGPLLFLVVYAQTDPNDARTRFQGRSFYGVLEVKEWAEGIPDAHRFSLYHGRILHGSQYLNALKRRMPTTYYTRNSGVGVAIRNFPRPGPLRVGAVGLGTGTVAAYARPGDYYRFYEINPQVIEVNQAYFTFVSERPPDATCDIILGDARLSMEREEPQKFDVLILDAFSGDAIPVHLLTREAMDVYERHLAGGAILAIHISNRHLNLVPVVCAQAEATGYRVLEVDTLDQESEIASASSQWLLLTNNDEFMEDQVGTGWGVELDPQQEAGPLWTDQFSSLFQTLD